MRYRLDDLGWFNFEKLIQALLKARLGLGVEVWGGSGDHGRDAYCPGHLSFPSREHESPGPFFFQAKYVRNASAAGSKWFPALRAAVRKEMDSLAKHRSRTGWSEPAQYVLLSNVPLTPRTRGQLRELLSECLPQAQITLCGGDDICALLDAEPTLRRAYPEILSLRDLESLLGEAVSRGILERSAAAVEESRDLVPVFVPTRAYYDALQTLSAHAFVVLEGAPEMGKTAIARTIALAYLMDGWQAVDCREPEDFFTAYSAEKPQVFVVDDAFGRTEYDPILGRRWERDLARVLCRINPTHHLIWTTRQHILARALRSLDLAGRAERFPAPAEVIVTASALSREEKARMLYRHCRAGRLSERARQVIREHALQIVEHPDLTPERIRRFTNEILPTLPNELSDRQLRQHIQDVIRYPTRRMRLAFARLGLEHKAVLLGMLESGGPDWRLTRHLGLRFADRHAAPRSGLLSRARAYGAVHPVATGLDDLLGTFLRARPGPLGQDWVRWIHPSYRDLVIEELAADNALSRMFLNGAAAEGIALALSMGGGARGDRDLPLLQTADSWDTLATAYARLAAEDPRSLPEMADQLAGVAGTGAGSPVPIRISSAARDTSRRVASLMGSAWESGSIAPTVRSLRTYFRLAGSAPTSETHPEIGGLWDATVTKARLQIGKGVFPDASALGNAVSLFELLEVEYPEFAGTADFKEAREAIHSATLEHAKKLSTWNPEPDEADRGWFEHAASTIGSLADAVGGLPECEKYEALVEDLRSVSEAYSAAGRDWEPDQQPDDEPEYESSENHGKSDLDGLKDELFDVSGLFRDI